MFIKVFVGGRNAHLVPDRCALFEKALNLQREKGGTAGAQYLFGAGGLHPVYWGVSKQQLTDFGEARAQNMGGTMTSVGTPIYIAPEVMRADHYDVKADTRSYGLCLVAMIRAERTLEQFFYQVSLPARWFTKTTYITSFFQALRKHKKRRTTKGLGMGQMTK